MNIAYAAKILFTAVAFLMDWRLGTLVAGILAGAEIGPLFTPVFAREIPDTWNPTVRLFTVAFLSFVPMILAIAASALLVRHFS